MSNKSWSFETRQIHAGQSPGPDHGRPRPAHLPDDLVRLPRRRHRGRPVRPRRTSARSTPASATRPSRSSRTAIAIARGRRRRAARWPPGQAAETYAILNIAEAGDHVVASPSLYGGTYNLLHYTLPKLGIETTFVTDPHDPQAWRDAVRPNTKLFFGETIPNPQADILDIEAVAAVAHEVGVPLIVDNTVATPYLIRPIEWGADVVVHSRDQVPRRARLGDRRGDRRRRHLRLRPVPRAVPQLQHPRPELQRSRLRPGPRRRRPVRRQPRPSSSRPACSCCATSARPSRRSTRSSSPRASRRSRCGSSGTSQNAQKVAEWLEARDDVLGVHYAGLASSPWHASAQKYAPRGAGRGRRLRDRGRRGGRQGVRGRARAALERREHRRRAVARDPPGVHHAQPAHAGGAAALRDHPGPGPPRGRASRTSRTSSPTSTPASGAAKGALMSMALPTRTTPARAGGAGRRFAHRADRLRPAAPRRLGRGAPLGAAVGRPAATCRPRAPRGARVTRSGDRQFCDIGPLALEAGGRPAGRADGLRDLGDAHAERRQRRPGAARAHRRLARHRARPEPGHPTGRLVGQPWSGPAARSTPTGGSSSRPTSSAAVRAPPARRRTAPDGRPWGRPLPVRDRPGPGRRPRSPSPTRSASPSWALVIGASMGGMRVLEWGVMAPGPGARDRAHRDHRRRRPATRSPGRTPSSQPSAPTPRWRGGDYYDAGAGRGSAPRPGHRPADRAHHLPQRPGARRAVRPRARRAARTPWRRRPLRGRSPTWTTTRGKLARRFDANSYLVLTESILTHDVGRDRGGVAGRARRR